MDPELRKRVLDTNQSLPRSKLTRSQKYADIVTEFFGSWKFIGSLAIFILIWMALNILAWLGRWDPYPFIMLNLVLSSLAAIQVPIILMSQNRMEERDRVKNERDFAVNRKAEREIANVQQDLEEIKKMIRKVQK